MAPTEMALMHSGIPRLFSTAYFFFRIFVLIFFVKIPSPINFLSIAMAHGFVLGLICLIRPYKSMAYTFLDASFFFIFLVASVFAVGVVFLGNSCNDTSLSKFLYISFYILLGTPLVYATILAVRCFIKALELVNFRSILSWRRRGYVEIGPYEAESVTVDRDWSRAQQRANNRDVSKCE